MPDHPLIYLASSSPRRIDLMRMGGWRFTALPANIDESVQEGEDPPSYVLRLAITKAREVAQHQKISKHFRSNNAIHGDDDEKKVVSIYILAADTAVVDGKDILGKPRDEAEAVSMLTRLRSRIHQVYTGLALARLDRKIGNKRSKNVESNLSVVTGLCMTDVVMRNYSDDEITSYVASGDPLDKAGSYAIQNGLFIPVKCIWGCYTNVMGLPLCHVAQTFREMGIHPPLENGQILDQCRNIATDECLDIDGCREIWAYQKGESTALASSVSVTSR